MTDCPFFPKCGGCTLLDLSSEEYALKKEKFIRRCFADHGLDNIVLAPLQQFPTSIRRRANFTWTKGKLGYFQQKTHFIQDISSCLLLTNRLNDFLPVLKKLLSSLFKQAEVFLLDTAFGIDLVIKANQKEDLTLLETLTDFAQKNQLARLTYNQTPMFSQTPSSLTATDFLQPSKEGEEFLQQAVLSALSNQKKGLDLFCGKGTFTYPLLEKGFHVEGYDISIPNSAPFHQRDLFRNPLLPTELNAFDFCIIDPPRAGALEQTKNLAESQFSTIIMISCFPATAGRDIHLLTEAGWQLQPITPVDQFQFSNHVELFCVLKKAI